MAAKKAKTRPAARRPGQKPVDRSEWLSAAHDLSGVSLAVFLNAEFAQAEVAKLRREGLELPPELLALITLCERTAQGAKAMSELSRQLVERLRGQPGFAGAEPFFLPTLAESVRMLLEARAFERGLSLDIPAPPRLTVLGDYAAVWRILFNVVENALRNTRHGGVSVAISFTSELGLCLDVRDTGVGFSAAAVRSGAGGFGVGLTLLRHQVERLRGTVRFDAEPAGGTRVRVLLPMRLSTAAGDGGVAADLHGLRVLLLDADLWRRNYGVHLLQRLGAVALSRTSSDDGKLVRRAVGLGVDLVLLRWTEADAAVSLQLVDRFLARDAPPLRILAEQPERVDALLGRPLALATPEQALEGGERALDAWVRALSRAVSP